MKTYSCAIIGCGNIAGGYDAGIPEKWSLTHAGAYHLCPATVLTAVADPDPLAAEDFRQKWKVQRAYGDYREMLQNEEIDILSLCLPTRYHFDAFREAIAIDVKGLFCEKPLSYDLEEARQMLEMAKGRLVSVNYFRRWNASLAKTVRRIKAGDFGKPRRGIIRYTKGLFGNASHMIDLVRWCFGEPEAVGKIRVSRHDGQDPGIDFYLGFKDGLEIYFINLPDVEYVFIDFELLLERGRVVIGQRGQEVDTYAVVPDPDYRFPILEAHYREQTEWRNCITRAVQEIVDCLEHGGRPSCTVEDAYRAQEICHRIVLS